MNVSRSKKSPSGSKRRASSQPPMSGFCFLHIDRSNIEHRFLVNPWPLRSRYMEFELRGKVVIETITTRRIVDWGTRELIRDKPFGSDWELAIDGVDRSTWQRTVLASDFKIRLAPT
jgi:hypothetical protein